MTIEIGEKVPEVTLHTMGEDGMQEVSTSELFRGKRAVLFGVPGAFTPGCSNTHLPGFVNLVEEFRAKGIDFIACVAVNDAFVMDAWCAVQGAQELMMLADGNGTLARALGLEMDASNFGMGERCKRFAMVIGDGVVEHLFVEPKGKITVSSAENVLGVLQG